MYTYALKFFKININLVNEVHIYSIYPFVFILKLSLRVLNWIFIHYQPQLLINFND